MRRQDLDPEGDDLTVTALAEMAQVRPRAVYQWLEQNRLPGAYKIGKAWWIPQQAVLDSLITLPSDTTPTPE